MDAIRTHEHLLSAFDWFNWDFDEWKITRIFNTALNKDATNLYFYSNMGIQVIMWALNVAQSDLGFQSYYLHFHRFLERQKMFRVTRIQR